MTVRLEVVPDDTWADHVADALVARLQSQPGLRVCLPTGDTPTPLYEALARRTDVSWSSAQVVLLDEYLGLPHGDPALAGDRLRRELLDRLPAPPAAYHGIDLEADPVSAAARHDTIAAAGLDLTLVGLGANGHVGFNEPGSGPDSPTGVVDLAPESRAVATASYGAGAAPQRGITLGLSRILASRELWLLVTGGRKAGVLARVLEGPEGEECPATYLLRHPALTILADEAAAAQTATQG